MHNSQDLINLVEFSLNRANFSKLNRQIYKLKGYSDRCVRDFLNKLCSYSSNLCTYLEVGTWQGSTLISALYGNNNAKGIAIDNFSQFKRPNLKEDLLKRLEKFIPNQYIFIEKDVFEIDLDFDILIDIYFYDGSHSLEDTRDSIVRFYGNYSDTFVLVVDDWNWLQPRQGTYEAIHRCGFLVKYQKEIISGYNNGLGIFVLSKKV